MCGVPEVGGVKEEGMALSWSLSPVLSPCFCFGNCIFCPQIFMGPVWSLLAIQAVVGNTPSFCTHRIFFAVVTAFGRSVICLLLV